MIKAKPVLKDKFWIVEDEGERVGTLTVSDDKYMLSSTSKGVRFFDNKRQLEKTLGKTVFEKATVTSTVTAVEHDKEVYGYPTSTTPYNTLYDVKQKLPLFTKSAKSKSLYCAGYYVIRFDKGWVQSHCPKLITLERYEYKGPYKTEFEMKQELSRAKR
jgi:hypothetical protein